MKIKVGIFFGGPSREREISFAGGRTVYDNLNKSIFEPVPIFVDSHKNLILLDWQHIYKGSIRDFYPPVEQLPASPNHFQVYLESLGELSQDDLSRMINSVGRKVTFEELPQLINIAFLALHGVYGEDGQIQEILQNLKIPYTGSGVRASQIGIDKAIQKEMMSDKGFPTPEVFVIEKEEWLNTKVDEFYQKAKKTIGFPLVVRPANQGSSIGVSIIDAADGELAFQRSVNLAFFREVLSVSEWVDRSDFEKTEYVRLLNDIRDGLGFPLNISIKEEQFTLFHPEEVIKLLDEKSKILENLSHAFILESHQDENKVIIESFIRGKEFSCIVIRKEDGEVLALPPTEIIKGNEVFDYKSKYLPGLSRKITPIDLPLDKIQLIRKECEKLFTELGFQVYARIDGFITKENQVFLNDPNTTSGMLPSSFFFHQAAEIGLNPSQFLTYILRTSLQERITEEPGEAAYKSLIDYLDEKIEKFHSEKIKRKKVGIILGGYSFERHISVESGRNIYEKLASSEKYEPVPIFLLGNDNFYELYQLPINLLLKDNADDIHDKILNYRQHPLLDIIKDLASDITQKYASEDLIFTPHKISYDELGQQVDAVFIALHGRPGEDGQVQMELEARNIPYNGSGIKSSSITINKFRTLQILKKNGFSVANQLLVEKRDFEKDSDQYLGAVESEFNYPFIAKPVDDGCSSAVKVIKTRSDLEAYSSLMFRSKEAESKKERKALKLKPKEEFPAKEEILFETLIGPNGAPRFLEITGGLLTHVDASGKISYEIFEPSEALASSGILSLEEKFLAGEGQNITPARLASSKEDYAIIVRQIKDDFEKAARILDLKGYARIDAFVRVYENNRVETVIVEVNSLPGMTPATCIFHQAAINDYKPYDFIDKIIQFGFGKDEDAVIEPPEKVVEAPIETVTATPVATITVDEPAINLDPLLTNQIMSSSNENSGLPNSFLERLKYFFTEIFNFIKSPSFLRNAGLILVFLFVFYFITTFVLRLYTHHGNSVQVGDYVGMNTNEAIRAARKSSFSVIINDSIFLVDQAPNTVLDQTPKALSRVKRKRAIYLTVTGSTPPMVPLPSLVGSYDYIQYTRKLRRLGIKFKVIEKKFDAKQEENTILHFFHGDRKISDNDLRKGIKIPKGSTLDFVVTERQTGMVSIPSVVCQKYEAAYFMITGNNLALGEVNGDVADQSNAYVYRQEPEYIPGEQILLNTKINVWLTSSRPAGCPVESDPSDLELRDTINND